MSTALKTILAQIEQLPASEVEQLRVILNNGTDKLAEPHNDAERPAKPPRDRQLPPIPVPDQSGALRWLAEHAREYAGQWVALDGDRLIAHGPDAREVYAAANASGVWLPLVDLVEDPDAPPWAGF